MRETLSIGLVTDIHYGSDFQSKKGSQALPLLENVVKHFNQITPDFVVDMGDRISDESAKLDLEHLTTLSKTFNKLSIPRHHIIGNHDIINLTRAENSDILSYDFSHKVIEVKGWRLVFWQPRLTNLHDLKFQHSESDIKWLRKILSENKKMPVVIFSHLPLAGAGDTWLGNRYFENNESLACYSDHAEIRNILEVSNSIVLCVSGHVHQNMVKSIRGIHYISLQSLSECSTTFPKSSETYGCLKLSDTKIEYSVEGNDWFSCQLPINFAKSEQFLAAFKKNQKQSWIIKDES